MPDTHVLAEHSSQGQLAIYDAIVIGAGISGLYMLYRLRELDMTARVFEAGTNVGGTWYWNRYPGARFDSESWTYGYSFSKELMAEWDWKEHFSPQPDTLEFVLFMTAVAFAVVWRWPDFFERCALYVLCSIAALLVGPTTHNNYMLWWIPFFCILLSWPLSKIMGIPEPPPADIQFEALGKEHARAGTLTAGDDTPLPDYAAGA